MNDSKTPSKKLTRVTAGILTVAFLGFIFLALGEMLWQSHGELIHSVQMTKELKATLPEHADRLDRFAARINSFTAAIGENMWLKDDMGYINSGFQYALGKRVINTGSQNMITLTDGHLYDLADYRSLEDSARDIVTLSRTTLSGIPFLFTYHILTLILILLHIIIVAGIMILEIDYIRGFLIIIPVEVQI